MWLFGLGVILLLLFSFVLLFGAPFLPTLQVSTTEALDLLDLRAGQTLLELGSGDSRVQVEAAKRGIYSIGYELNPILVIWARISTWRYRRFITVRWGNFWRHQLPVTDGIYVFLLDKYMKKLHTKIEQDKAGWGTKKRLKVVSFAFEIPGRKPSEVRNGLFLYRY